MLQKLNRSGQIMYNSGKLMDLISKMPQSIKGVDQALSNKLQTIAVTSYLRCRKALNDFPKLPRLNTFGSEFHFCQFFSDVSRKPENVSSKN